MSRQYAVIIIGAGFIRFATALALFFKGGETLNVDAMSAAGPRALHDQSPVDFHLQYINRTVSSGFNSRLREVNENSSFSVLG